LILTYGILKVRCLVVDMPVVSEAVQEQLEDSVVEQVQAQAQALVQELAQEQEREIRAHTMKDIWLEKARWVDMRVHYNEFGMQMPHNKPLNYRH